ncbi:MAG: quinolinate synthase NadA [Bacteroidales bacterium]|jgi:quinolinate synthase
MIDEIKRLRKEKNAVILAHYYQESEIQDIADFIGDSLTLSQQAAKTNADIIVFAGVNFMAEVAKILNPFKKVLIPDTEAGCSLSDLCKKEDFIIFLNKYPEHKVISYINCSTEIKALSDVICTSSNAVSIVESFPKNEKIIFAPDKNLGAYVNNITGRNMVLWDGSCIVHEIYSLEKIMKLKIENPDAKLIAHPECREPLLKIADFIGSTTSLLNYTIKNDSKKFIVATETGIIHQMKKESPDKIFISAPVDDSECACGECKFMRLNTLEKLYLCLQNEKPEIIIDEELRIKAEIPIRRMLKISGK